MKHFAVVFIAIDCN